MSTHDEDTKKGFPFDMGFRDVSELHRLVALVRLNSQEEVDRFERWKRTDGSKNGLLYLLGVLVADNPMNNVYENVEARDRYFQFLKDEAQGEFTYRKHELEVEYFNELRNIEMMRLRAELATPKKIDEK